MVRQQIVAHALFYKLVINWHLYTILTCRKCLQIEFNVLFIFCHYIEPGVARYKSLDLGLSNTHAYDGSQITGTSRGKSICECIVD